MKESHSLKHRSFRQIRGFKLGSNPGPLEYGRDQRSLVQDVGRGDGDGKVESPRPGSVGKIGERVLVIRR